jgi:hypothetical protein
VVASEEEEEEGIKSRDGDGKGCHLILNNDMSFKDNECLYN